ncbi:DUF6463 family protein [Isoptericola sp. G70]|uniref:DUF6463 family protein n=1 Tax=Isoptericola sp. G70 TaxID=3376633 RepID=UPI003A800048
MEQTKSTGAGLTRTAGILMIVIAVLHAVVTTTSHWSGWLAGNLRDRTASAESVAAFWAQPGGFAVVVLVLGLLVVRAANRGDRLPAYVGWSLLGWVVLCLVLIGPASGFSLALVPAALLVAADVRARLATRRRQVRIR